MKSFLHPLFLIVLLLSLPGQSQGQKICGYVDNGYVYELYNHEVARSNTTAYVFNRTFIKSLIGLSPDSIWTNAWNSPMTNTSCAGAGACTA